MRLRAADLFCGAGGTSQGAKQTGGCDVVFALNHWNRAIQTHSANFPTTLHVNSRLEQTSPSVTEGINLLFASPECTHHSRARGAKPTSDQQRAGAWYVMPWIEHHRPSWIVIENVTEFRDWGPVDANGQPLKSMKGKFFDAWIMAIRAAGYRVDDMNLNAADFGAATSRNRMFVVARLGKRNPVFPSPTHAKHVGGELPGMALKLWRPAYEVIDWSIPCPSIFSRKRQLADKTLLRIEAGLRRFVGPFVAQWDNHGGNGSYTRPLSGPLATMTTKANMGLVMPYQVVLRQNQDAADINGPLSTITTSGAHHGVALPFVAKINHGDDANRDRRVSGVEKPFGAITCENGHAVVMPFVLPRQGFYDCHTLKRSRGVDEPLPTITASHVPGAVVAPVLGDRHYLSHEERPLHAWRNWPDDVPQKSPAFMLSTGSGGAPRGVSDPLPTIVTVDGTSLAMPWLSHYYGTDNHSPLSEPVDTITTKDRHSLCVAVYRGPEDWPAAETDAMRILQKTMKSLGVCDIGFRMLDNHELSAAQGFPSDYIFHGRKKEVTRQIGNSVSPCVAQAITEEILAA